MRHASHYVLLHLAGGAGERTRNLSLSAFGYLFCCGHTLACHEQVQTALRLAVRRAAVASATVKQVPLLLASELVLVVCSFPSVSPTHRRLLAVREFPSLLLQPSAGPAGRERPRGVGHLPTSLTSASAAFLIRCHQARQCAGPLPRSARLCSCWICSLESSGLAPWRTHWLGHTTKWY